VRTENEAYRASEIKRLAEEAIPDDYTTGLADANDLKTAKWRLATDVLAQTTKLESRIHAIERIPSEGRGKAAQFIPVRFVFRNKLTKGDKLLLAFDAVVLSELLGRPVTMGKIIHGDDHSTLKVKTATLTKPVGKLIEKSTALLSTYKPPDLVLNRHCGECEFQTRCREKAIEKDDLSLLAGMSEKERKKSGVRMAARIHRNLDAHRLLHGTRIHAPSVASLRGCPT
jgi:predicted RecB family nuclease